MTYWISSDNSLTESSDLKDCDMIVKHPISQHWLEWHEFKFMFLMKCPTWLISSLSALSLLMLCVHIWLQLDLLFIKLNESCIHVNAVRRIFTHNNTLWFIQRVSEYADLCVSADSCWLLSCSSCLYPELVVRVALLVKYGFVFQVKRHMTCVPLHIQKVF